MKPKKKSKYGNTKCRMFGIDFDSKKECERYIILRDEQKRGVISDLQLQVKFPLEVNGMHVAYYFCDFTYKRPADGDVVIVEDVKSEITSENPTYRLKNKLMKAIHGITILET